MPIGYKMRKWQAVFTVSASGPEFSPVLDEGGRFLKPRMAADLRYTTADVDFLEAYFRRGDYDSGQEEFHRRLRNPTREQFFQALGEIERWFLTVRGDPDWDGGGLLFCYAGHGRQGDGGLVLADGIVKPNEFISSLRCVATAVSPPGRLRVSAMLDSCHSAAFTTKLLYASLSQHQDVLVPFHVYASCMEDEFAWEESSLGHGVFTYSFSVREPSLGSLAATAIQPDNTYGPSLAIAGGDLGCSFLTVGRQNPVRYWAGNGHLEVASQTIDLFRGDDCMSIEEMRAWLRRERDSLVSMIRTVRQDLEVGDISSDDQMRAEIHELIEFLRNPEPISMPHS
jgi:hypothetical protein